MTGLSFIEVFDAAASVVPDRPAVLWRDEVVSFAELRERTDHVARGLLRHGLAAGRPAPKQRWESGQHHVAVVMRNRPEWIETMLGSFAARAVPINVNYRYVAQELLQLLRLTKPSAIVYETTFASQLEPVQEALDWWPLWVHVEDESGADPLPGSVPYASLHEAVGARPLPATSPDDLYILCTGGTTGMPKAVLWRQADVFVAAMGGRDPRSGAPLERVEDVKRRVHPSVRPALPAVPLMHGAGQWNTLSTLFAGQPVVLPGVVDHLDAADVWRCVERHRATSLIIAGNAFARPLVDALDSGSPPDLSSLRVILSGAVALSTDLKGALLRHLPAVTIVDAAGASESGTALMDRSSAGKPVVSGVFEAGPGTVILADDRRTPIESPDPTPGWLARSGTVPLGYLDDADRTEETFPEIDGTRYAVPGDRAQWLPGGEIELLGRDAMTINSGGEKIFAEEVEGVLTKDPAVYDALVVGRPSERWGQEIVAVVQLRDGAAATVTSIRERAAGELARYKLPKDVIFVDQIRRTPAGKADYGWARVAAAAAVT